MCFDYCELVFSVLFVTANTCLFPAFSVELFSFPYMTVSSFSSLVCWISFSILTTLFTKFESANASMRS